jgi:hypothetical protein
MNDTTYYAAKAAYEEGYESAKEELTAARAEITQLKAQLTQTQGTVTISRNGYVQELEQQRDRLADLTKQFIAILDITEESDSGRLFHPTNIISRRAGDLQKIGELFEALRRASRTSPPIPTAEITMSEKLTMPKNVQAFVNKYGRIGSKEQDATFWKDFRKAANAYADVQAKRICDLEHTLATVTEQRDKGREHREKLLEILQNVINQRATITAQRDRLACRNTESA